MTKHIKTLRPYAPLCALLALLSGCGTTDAPTGSLLPSDTARSGRIPWNELDESTLRQKITQLIPAGIKDRKGWASDLQNAYASLKIPVAAETFCAAIAVIEQESNYQADPVVPGLPDIVQRELDQRAGKYGIPKMLISTALLKASPDGRSYRERIDALKTEKQLNTLFEDMISELPFGPRLLTDYNPVRTAGPMQVSVKFAEQHVAEKNYPYPITRTVRDEVFTRRGGLYFGSAILLDYPAPYDEIVYRFADFNAGRYASRNAAFQKALSVLSGKPLTQDGDLLRYKDGKAVETKSETENALLALAGKLQMNPDNIRRDLRLEKQSEFAESLVYKRLFNQAEKLAGKALPRQAMPKIDLKSPKITRQLTTEWFARRVESRYRNCLTRSD